MHDLACDATPSKTVDLRLDEHTKMRYAGRGPHVGDMQNSQAPCPCSHFLRQNSKATKSQIRCGSTRAPDRKPSTARFRVTGSTKPEPHKESRLKRSRTWTLRRPLRIHEARGIPKPCLGRSIKCRGTRS